MQVILLEKVANLGNLGDVVKVKDGFARNFLIPTRRARRATESAMKEFEAKRVELEKVASDKLAAAQAMGEKLNGKTISITQKAGVDVTSRIVEDSVHVYTIFPFLPETASTMAAIGEGAGKRVAA